MSLEKTGELVVNLNNNFPNYGFINKVDEEKNRNNPTHILRDNQGHKLSDSPMEFRMAIQKFLYLKEMVKFFLSQTEPWFL